MARSCSVSGIQVKTTIEISDDLMRRARQLALDRNVTLRAIVEEGLEQLLGSEDRSMLPVRFVTYRSTEEPLSAETLERVRQELLAGASLPSDERDWWMKRFGSVPPGLETK